MNYHCVKMLSLVLVLLVFDDDGRTNACVRRWLFLFGLNCSQNFFYWRHSGYTSKPRPSRHKCHIIDDAFFSLPRKDFWWCLFFFSHVTHSHCSLHLFLACPLFCRYETTILFPPDFECSPSFLVQRSLGIEGKSLLCVIFFLHRAIETPLGLLIRLIWLNATLERPTYCIIPNRTLLLPEVCNSSRIHAGTVGKEPLTF